MSVWNKIIIIYDCPWENCDKKWLYNGLEGIYGNKVIKICPRKNLFQLSSQGFLGKLERYWINMNLILKSVTQAKSNNDIIISWNPWVGMFTKFFWRKKNVIALNWLVPNRNLFKKIKKYCFESSNFYASVNDNSSIELWKNALDLKDTNHIFYLPDVPETEQEYEIIEKKQKYCFTGGLNNRDWNSVINLAKRNPNIQFVCVAERKDFEKNIEHLNSLKNLPNNIDVYFNISLEEYDSLLKNSYVLVLPLRSNRVSGLINVIKAIQYGVITITSNVNGINQYFPKEYKKFLSPIGDCDKLNENLNEIFQYDEEIYKACIIAMRKHLSDNFSQKKAVSCICDILKKYNSN